MVKPKGKSGNVTAMVREWMLTGRGHAARALGTGTVVVS